MKLTCSLIAGVCILLSNPPLHAATIPTGISLARDNTGYLISFELPGDRQIPVMANGSEYIALDIPTYGLTSEAGLPALPIVSFNVMIAPEEDTVMTSVLQQTTDREAFAFRLLPAQEPWPKSRPISERPFRINQQYYNSRGRTDQPFVTVSQPFVIAGARGVTITLFPYVYNPSRDEATLVRRATIRVNLRHVPRTEVRFTRSLHDFLNTVFVNFDARKTAGNGNYLIITAPQYESTLAGFVSFKQSTGYPVSVATTVVTGTTNTAIKNYIQQRYNNPDTRPEFILLVGDIDRIPEWVGSTTDNPHTDLFYTHLDGTDYYPDASIGRFAVADTTQLQNIINKTIFMENSINGLPKKNVFLASDDNYTVSEGTHNAVIDTFFQPHGYVNLKRYTHSYSATTQEVLADLNSNQTFAIYSGHGSETSWADGPPVSQSQVRSLVNTVYPYVYSFACLTGSFETPECFGETWIRIPKGGSAFWGSSVTSYWDEDDILERRLVHAMFADSLSQSAPAFNRGKIYLANYYGGMTATVKRYFEMYNLLGDPSLHTAAYATNFGWAKGAITSSGAPLPGVSVDFVEPVIQQGGISNADGLYLAGASVDSSGSQLTVRARKFGFLDCTTTTTLTRHDTVALNFSMTVAPGGMLRVHTYEIDSTSVRANVRVILNGSPVINDFTDSLTGCYVTPLPGGTYTVVVDPPSPFTTRIFAGTIVTSGETTAVGACVRYAVEPAPATLLDTLQPGGAHTKMLILTNTTTDSIHYRVTDELALRLARPKTLPVQPRAIPVPAAKRPKGTRDPNHGSLPKNSGGPDEFGYRWIDSDTTGGPAFSWFDIDALGTPITAWSGSPDDGYFSTSLPWPFPFYGNDYSTINIGTNGFLNFGTGSTEYSNDAIPSPAEPNNAIYAFWDDLTLVSRGRVTFYNDAANSRFIVQYTRVPSYSSSSDSLTFQILLEPNGDIRYQYLRMTSNTLNSATIGLEDAAGTVGLQVVNSASYVHNNLAVGIYLPDASWLSESPRAGMLPPDSSVNVTVTFDAHSLPPNSLNRADIHLVVSHPDVSGDIIVPVILMVQPTEGVDGNIPPTPQEFVLAQNYPNPFNPTTVIRYGLTVPSFVSLKIFDLLGREVMSLVNTEQTAGLHETRWDASKVSSGVYFYRLTAGRFVDTKKLLLVR